MANLLDNRLEEEIAESVLEALSHHAITAEEAIPGLVLAIKELAYSVDGDRDEVLEEAADQLAEG